MLRAVLVDDEILALNLLDAVLNEIGGVEVVGKFTSAIEAMEQMEQLNPDILFLDIEMSEMNGMKIAEKIEQKIKYTDVVFVTAYDEYALNAFNVGASDYILKPIVKERLEKTIGKIAITRKTMIEPEKKSSLSLTATFFDSFNLIGTDKQKIKWRTKKVKELCAFLLHHSSPVHKDVILENLWPALPVEKALSILHTTIYQLRKELKNQGFEEPIQYIDERYSLLAQIESDVDIINNILAKISVPKEDLRTVLDIYKGDYLAQDGFPWSIECREQVRKDIIRLLESSKILGTGSEQELIQDSMKKLVELDPLEEKYNVELIRLYIKLGKQRDALDSFTNYKNMVWSELGIKLQRPMDEFIKIYN